ncbi:MAG: PEP-CTERM sorting domain-containing protein [Bryobacteraceae bacterium]|nr:PEP-CTERM sorting domain-containing protein [Bryobacteraceae bacterium]
MTVFNSIRFAVLAVLFSTGGAAAPLFVLDNSTRVAMPGEILVFAGSITNEGTDEVFLNGTSFTVSSVLLWLDDNPFYLNTPVTLVGGAHFYGELFTVAIDSLAEPGTYTGTFTILGGSDAQAFDVVGINSFDVTVSTVPEPSTVAMLISAAALLALYRCNVSRCRSTDHNTYK